MATKKVASPTASISYSSADSQKAKEAAKAKMNTTTKTNSVEPVKSNTGASPTASINYYSNSKTSQASKNLGNSTGSKSATTYSASTTPTSTGFVGGGIKYINDSPEKDYESDYLSRIEDMYAEIQRQQEEAYAKQIAQQTAALNAAKDQAVNELNSQKTDVSNEYADMYRQLYLQKMASEKNMAQQLAAQGITGGGSESTMLGLNTDYSNALQTGKQNESKAQSELDQAITNTGLATSQEIAQATADNAINSANSYASALQNLINQYQTAYQYEQEANNTNRNHAYNMAMQMLQSGITPSDDLLSTAGISKTDALAIVAGNTKASSGSSSGSSTSSGNIDYAYARYLQGAATTSDMNLLFKEYGVSNEAQLKATLKGLGADIPTTTTSTSTKASATIPVTSLNSTGSINVGNTLSNNTSKQVQITLDVSSMVKNGQTAEAKQYVNELKNKSLIDTTFYNNLLNIINKK